MEKKNSLLIVDDDTSILMELIHILQPDYKILTAKDGETAIKTAGRAKPDLILLDVIMPGISGFDVLAKLKESPDTENIPVIFLTGLSQGGGENKGLALGAVDYITKPFEETVVKLRVNNHIQIINLQRHLESAVLEAKAANQAKSEFLANVNHEIRTPMNVIVGLTELLLDDESLSSEVLDNLEKMSISCNTLMALINNVLDFSKIESGKLMLTPIRYEVANLISDVVTLNSMRLKDKPVDLQLNIDDNLFNEFYGDDLHVKQIINNLLSNAMKYTREGTVTLSVNCTRLDDENVMLTVTVSDTGIGMRQEDLDKIFTQYDQVDARVNRSIEGTGLGLSIAKRLAELMGGEISVESEYGKGSTFTVSVKQGFVSNTLISPEMITSLKSFKYDDRDRRVARKLERPDLSYAKVLVVDDFKHNLDVAAGLLGKYNINVDCVMSGPEAIELIESGEPVYDAVFMDFRMPDMDGVETTGFIRNLGTEYAETLPIIALTASAVAEYEEIFLDKGFQDFLSKPVSIVKLDEVIRKWIMKDAAGFDTMQEDDPKLSDEGEEPSPGLDYPPGINAKYGLSLYDGDREMFIGIMQSYVDGVPPELDKLPGVTEESLRTYAIDIHTVKGGSASIGARELADRAAELEAMAKAGDLAGVLAKNDDFIKDARKMVADIQEWLK